MRARLSWSRWVVRAGVLAGLLTALPGLALAHATLVGSDPADGAILAEAPSELRMWFSEAISPVFSSAQLMDINSQPVEIAGLRTDPADPKLMILDLTELPDGVYSVLSKLLSESDGHFSRTFLVFGIGENADLGTVPVAETRAPPPLPDILLRWLNYGTLVALIGALAAIRLVLLPASAAGGGVAAARWLSIRARVLTWAAWCSGLALAAGVGLLLRQTCILVGTLPEGASFGGVAWEVLVATRWGILWLVREGILLALSLTLWTLYRTRPRSPGAERQALASALGGARASGRGDAALWLWMALLCLALVTAQALTGHAAAATPDTALAVVAAMVHLLAASVWVGGLLALAIGLLPFMRYPRSDFAALAHAAWGSFSRYAALSVGLLFATGLYGMGRQVASVDALLTTLYGQVLAAKVGLVLAVGAFGLTNSMLLHPRLVAAPLARLLGRPMGWAPLPLRRLPLLVSCEASLALLVLLATGLVTATETAQGPEFRPLPEHVPGALSKKADDLVVTLSVKPNRPGQNVLTVFTASTRRPPPAEIIRVILRFSYLDEDMGRVSVNAEEIEPGRFVVGGNYLSLVGAWQIDVVVRRRGIEDSVARFHWLLPPPGGSRPEVVSNAPLEAPMTVAGAGIIVLVLTAVTLTAWRRPRKRPVGIYSAPATPQPTDPGGTHDQTNCARMAGWSPLAVARQPRSQWV